MGRCGAAELPAFSLVFALVLGLSVIAGPTPGRAQAQEPVTPTQDETDDKPAPTGTHQEVFRGAVVVEGSPIVEGSTLDLSGSLVTAVSEQQVDDLHAQDLTSALRRVPGVAISRYNAIGAFGGGDGGAFFIRGHGSGRPGSDITMLTDGIPRVVGIWNHPLLRHRQ